MTTTDPKVNETLALLLRGIPRGAIWQSHAALARGDFAAVLVDVEARLGAAPDLVGERLLWVLAQVELANVPVSALSGPLEETLPKLSFESDTRALGIYVLARYAQKLVEKGQMRLALLILERCREQVLAEPTIQASAGRAVDEALLAVTEEELKRAELRKERPAALSALREKIAELKRRVSAQAPVREVAKSPSNERTKNTQRSAKGILESALLASSDVGVERSNSGASPVGPAARPLASAAQQEAPIDSTAEDSSHRDRLRFLRFGSAAVVLIGIYLAIHVSFPKSAAELEDHRLSMSIGAEVKSPLTLPDPTADVVGVSQERTPLRDLTRRLESLKESSRVPPEGGDQGSTSSAPSTGSSDGSSSPIAVDAERRPREVLREADRKKLPDLDAERLSNTVLDNLGQVSSSGMSAPPSLGNAPVVVGTDGRAYGAPLENSAAGSQQRALDGSPLREYPVEQLPNPELYRIIAPTKVLSAPSVVAVSLGELRRDAVIQVVARMGLWLVIRSTGGRRGFVYAQDAAPNQP